MVQEPHIRHGKTGAWLWCLRRGIWEYEIDETQVGREVLAEINSKPYWTMAIISAELRRPVHTVPWSTGKLPPGEGISVVVIGPKPPYTPDEMVKLIKEMPERIAKIPFFRKIRPLKLGEG